MSSTSLARINEEHSIILSTASGRRMHGENHLKEAEAHPTTFFLDCFPALPRRYLPSPRCLERKACIVYQQQSQSNMVQSLPRSQPGIQYHSHETSFPKRFVSSTAYDLSWTPRTDAGFLTFPFPWSSSTVKSGLSRLVRASQC